MKHSICNIQLLPKAADLRKKRFDEFRLNMLIALFLLLSRNAMKSWLTSSSFLIPSFPGPRFFLPNCLKREAGSGSVTTRRNNGNDHKKSDGFYFILNNIYSGVPSSVRLV